MLTTLHWLVNNSEFDKNEGIALNDSWFQEFTESAEETVKAFLEVTTEQTSLSKGNTSSENQIHEQDTSTAAKDWTETEGYDSDR